MHQKGTLTSHKMQESPAGMKFADVIAGNNGPAGPNTWAGSALVGPRGTRSPGYFLFDEDEVPDYLLAPIAVLGLLLGILLQCPESSIAQFWIACCASAGASAGSSRLSSGGRTAAHEETPQVTYQGNDCLIGVELADMSKHAESNHVGAHFLHDGAAAAGRGK